MSFTWISETFGSIETKKAVLSVKKVLKITSKSFSFKKYNQNRISLQEKNLDFDFNITKTTFIPQPLNFILYFANRQPVLDMAAADNLTRQLLFPKHGFW
jgi:hypothetical protein